ncbi:MAG: YkvA family protein [Omnitrophica WOR_2 bacterium]
MPDNQSNGIFQGKKTWFLSDVMLRVKLIARLMLDRRVNPLLKLIPIGALIYLINPIDIPGPVDDAAVLGLGSYLFVLLCPADVVQEHMAYLNAGRSVQTPADENVVDAEYKEVK